ncbi:MAG: ATP-binding protein [Acidithiobacillus sp.]|nr:ATP-binding protein [Acidithiobacillus sp.]
MTILDNIQANSGPRAIKMVIHGENGIGKTTFAAGAPKPLILAVEDGIGVLNVPSLRIRSSDELQGALMELLQGFRSGARPFDSVVLDSLDALEAMVWKKVCETGHKKNIEDFGYGKGYIFALQKWAEIRDQFQAINDCGIHTIAIAQSNNKTNNDPVYGSYNRTILRLHEKAAGLWRDWADIMGFATQRLSLKGDDKGAPRAVAMGERVLEIGSSPAYWSKNRFNMPSTLPLSWNAMTQNYLAAFQNAASPSQAASPMQASPSAGPVQTGNLPTESAPPVNNLPFLRH